MHETLPVGGTLSFIIFYNILCAVFVVLKLGDYCGLIGGKNFKKIFYPSEI